MLVTAAGTIVAQGIIKCLKLANSEVQGKVEYRMIAVDASPMAAGLYRGHAGVIVPLASSPDYIESVIKACRENEILAIFVGADEELIPLETSRKRIETETDAKIIASPLGVLSTCLDKWKTFQLLSSKGLPCAASSLPEDREGFIREFGFPVVVKPREGHGSRHFFIAGCASDVEEAMATITKAGWHPMLQEHLRDDGGEFTSGVTVDFEGRRVMSSISMRRTLRDGQTNKAFIDDFEDVRRWAERTALAIGGRGPINVQARLAGSSVKTFEINPRFSGSSPMRAVAGVNEPDIVFRNRVCGEEVEIRSYRRLVCFRYWNELYVPYSEYERMSETGAVEGSGSFIPEYF